MSVRHPALRMLLLAGATAALVGTLACLALAGQRRGGDGAQGPLHVVFRYDDYGQRAQASVNEGVIDAFRRHRVPLTVAVVPCPDDAFAPADAGCREPMDAGRTATLVAAHREGVAEIALHGYSHAEAGRAPGKSEFRGVDPAEQRSRLLAALDEVERRTGVRPKTFVPPFDTYDAATLRALEALGMRTLSGGLYAAPEPGSGLRTIPNTVYLGTLNEAVQAAALSPDPGAVMVAIFHPWDLREATEMQPLEDIEKAFDLPWLDALLDWLATQPQVQVTTMQALAASDADLGRERYQRHLAHVGSKAWPLLLPPFGRPPALQMQTLERYDQLERELWLRLATQSVAVLTAVSAVGAALLAAFGRPRGLCLLAIGGGAAVALLGPLAMGSLGWKDFALLLVAGGAALAGAVALADARAAARAAG